MSESVAHRHQQRALMWRLQGGRCWWCNRMTVLPRARGQTHRKVFPDNEATIEHLDSRLSPERGRHSGRYRRVMACRRCNNERARKEAATVAIQTIWQRSGSFIGIACMAGAFRTEVAT